jgi:hypothetical protein
MCAVLCSKQPITFVYSWHEDRAKLVTEEYPRLLPPVRILTSDERHYQEKQVEEAERKHQTQVL